jgi:AcrR family transcriptional regulator
MEKRRQRILEQARKMLAAGGFEALNLRDLAEVSEVTVPTLYNLIGNKTEILKALVLNAFAEYEAEMDGKTPLTEDLPALMVSTFTDLIHRDEDYYRATVLASERVELEADDHRDYGYKRGPLRRYARHLCQTAVEEGLLRGDIDQGLLVEQMIGAHQVAFRDWAYRVISLEDLRKKSLSGFYLALAADAVDDFRLQLVEKLEALYPD